MIRLRLDAGCHTRQTWEYSCVTGRKQAIYTGHGYCGEGGDVVNVGRVVRVVR